MSEWELIVNPTLEDIKVNFELVLGGNDKNCYD